ncbi:DUF2934 domain-containing protein [Rhizobium leguminosarum]|uniref:DUF2934 domain-containing protein n=1 Tax=Rhizobium leguminosarum TaxID=384 RepID=UPI00103E0485|nr:DUF2934 domain-containing protein [Rhizobium leguminosarum]TCA57163.1 DUF2934 domain-containing protein [Rhizobium leguminosarum bv. viciae]TCB22082.1 DUF2934 domain-containing protein [Rhizobium leguminosarum bv. viciae]
MAKQTKIQHQVDPINENFAGNVPGAAGEGRSDRIRDRARQIWEADGRPDNRQDEHWLQAEREISHGGDAMEGDDLPNLDALREAAREHSDAFIVKTDLEDADQREATPGVREQP